MASGIQGTIDRLLGEGFEIAQQGRIVKPNLGPGQRECFSDRAEGFSIHLLGTYAPPTYRSVYENRLLDDKERWVHLRRDRRAAD